MKKLNQLISCDYDIEISGITTDSRKVEPGYLFVATKGFNVDHFDYIEDAISRGAVAVIVDRQCSFSIPTVFVLDIDKTLIKICETFYEVDISEFHFVGITGTDGKTTTAMITRNLLNMFYPTAYLGTNGLVCGDDNYATSNTTPCIEELYHYFSIIKEHKCKHIVMEVSSEALLHHRVDSIIFDVVAFTNITEDHLNVHKTLEKYRSCKFKLAELCKPSGKIFINGDDKNCQLLTVNDKVSFGLNSGNDCVISDVNKCKDYVNFMTTYQGKQFTFSSPFVGLYNVYNVTLAWLIVGFFVSDLDVLSKKISLLPGVLGRREIFKTSLGVDILLDYAHTENGILNLLRSLDDYKSLIVVTGAAGGREVEKRSRIGDILFKYATFIVFTMDDPRYEDPEEIAKQIIGKHQEKNYTFIKDRKEAISYALSISSKDSVVAVIGKGRDNYMAIEDKRLPYSDYDVIKKLLK